jgi:hypothetical protein
MSKLKRRTLYVRRNVWLVYIVPYIMKYDTIPYLYQNSRQTNVIVLSKREPYNKCFSPCWYFERTLYLCCSASYHKAFRADISRRTKICAPSATRILVLREF